MMDVDNYWKESPESEFMADHYPYIDYLSVLTGKGTVFHIDDTLDGMLGVTFTDGLREKIQKSNVDLLKNLYDLVRDSSTPVIEGRETKHEPTADLKNILGKFPELDVQANSVSSSVARGFRDLVRGDSLKTEMKAKIKTEIFEPLKDYLNKEDVETSRSKSEINKNLDSLEKAHFSGIGI